MGGGGTIIIRNNIAEAFKDPLVIGAVPTALRPHLDHILAKDPGTWSERAARYVLYCAGEVV